MRPSSVEPEHVVHERVVPQTRPQTGPQARPHTRRPAVVLGTEVAVVASLGLVAGVVVGAGPWLTPVLVLATVLCRFHAGLESVRPGLPHAREVLAAMVLPFAGAAVVAGFVAADAGAVLRDSVAIVATMALADLAAGLLRRRVGSPARVLVVGDRGAVQKAAARWAGDDSVTVVGGLLVGDSVAGLSLGSTLGVRTVSGTDEVAMWANAWAADLVVIAPGRRVSSQFVRTLGWLLERNGTALAVLGVLDSVAPHRIDSTALGGATLLHARASRPPLLARALKWGFDRVAGTALLIGLSPVLVATWAWVRLDSRGPGFFRQVRVGLDGRLFTVLKLRTMVDGAEAQLSALAEDDQGSGLLFKIHDDPRTTRAGRLLRRTSLDELPQLWNVVRGEMSLVGPRPALPTEVAQYDAQARRRLAVRPGMTGLWQVSGRSDLDWDHSIDLDVHYVDNHRFADDLVIGLRTFKAVRDGEGAY